LRLTRCRSRRAEPLPTFSLHDLPDRRISLVNLAGVPWARIGKRLGQRNLALTANAYTHVSRTKAT
jgi:hypothetical protein